MIIIFNFETKKSEMLDYRIPTVEDLDFFCLSYDDLYDKMYRDSKQFKKIPYGK